MPSKKRSAKKSAGSAKRPTNLTEARSIFLDKASDSVKRSSMLTLDGFDNFISRTGLNNNNALSASTYEFNLITRNRLLLEASYRGSWIVGKIVDCFAEDMTREGIEWTTTKDDEDPNVLKKAISRLKINQSMCFAEKMGRLYGAAIGVYQIKGQKMDTPLDLDTISKDQFQGIIVYDRWQLNPVLTDVIDSGPDIGLPKYYDVVNNPTQTDPTSNTATGQVRIHYSRLFRDIGIDLPYFQAITEQMWGESILERLWDRLISFDNVTMSAANLVERANLRTVGIAGLREIIAAGGEAQQGLVGQFEMMRLAQSNEGLTLIDKEDTFQTTAYSFAGLSDMMLQFSQQMSGACDTPMVRLFSQSPAGMNSTGESDLRMYYDSVKAKQEAKFRAPWETLLAIMWRSVYGKPAPEDLTFEFVPLWQMSATDKATVAKTTTDTIIEAHEAGLVPTAKAMKELQQASAEIGIFSSITDEDITEVESEDPPLPGEEPAGEGIPPLAESGGAEEPRFPKEMKKGFNTGESKDSAWKRLWRKKK